MRKKEGCFGYGFVMDFDFIGLYELKWWWIHLLNACCSLCFCCFYFTIKILKLLWNIDNSRNLCDWVSLLLIRPRTLFIPGHRLLLILPLLLFSSMIRMPERTSRRNFLKEVFIRNAELFCRTSPTLTYPLSFTVGVESHCVTSRSPVHLCWFRSFTPTCMDLILQYLPFILAFDVHV